MKCFLLVCFSIVANFFLPSDSLSQQIWQGQIGTKRIALKIESKKDTGIFISPEQNINGLKTEKLTITADSLTAIGPSYFGAFRGSFSSDKKVLTGKFIKQGKSFNLVLKAVPQIMELNLPQTPKPPFPYQTENIVYPNADKSISFGATLTLPKQAKACAAVILVSGTGKQDRDGTMAGHKMFAVIADYLTRKGIAVLRVDDRGTGQTTGKYEDATTADFASDVLTAIDYLKSVKQINPKKIGLIGHSEGGAVIAIATAQSKDVSFLISIAGLASPGFDALIQQNLDIVQAANIPQSSKNRFDSINRIMFNVVYQNADSANLEQKLRTAFADWKKKDDAFVKDSLKIQYDHFFFPLESYVRNATGNWYRYFIKYDPASTFGKIKIPILAINGDKDVMVNYKTNLENIKKYAEMAGNHHVTTVVMPGLNHLFQHCQTCTNQEYGDLDETFSTDVLQLMSGWITKTVQ